MNKFLKRVIILIPFTIFSNSALAQGHGGLPSGAEWLVIILLLVFCIVGFILMMRLSSRVANKGKSDISQQGGEFPLNTKLSFKGELITELVMATEDEFQIVITDEEIKKCGTANLLTDLVYSKMKKTEDGTYSSIRGLYAVRRILMEKFDVDRKKVREETRLDAIIPRENRAEKWRALLYAVSEGKKVYVPLERPMGVKMLMISLILIASCIAFINVGMLAIIFSLFICLFIWIVTLPFKKEFPLSFEKVKDLMGVIEYPHGEECGREDVYSRVVLLVSMKTGKKGEEVLPNDYFLDVPEMS